MKTQMTLLELSNVLVSRGYPDLFDFDVESDILDIKNMKGSIADEMGENLVEFDIIELGDESYFEHKSHLDTIVSVDLS